MSENRNDRLIGLDAFNDIFIRIVFVSGMAGVNAKEGIVNLLKKDSMTRGINVTLNNRGKLVIDFHVIVSYGVNIVAVADNLVESVRYRVEEFTGVEVERINIYVEGVRLID